MVTERRGGESLSTIAVPVTLSGDDGNEGLDRTTGVRMVRMSLKTMVVGLCLSLGAAATGLPVQASDEVYAALAQRGLTPWPEAFLAETEYAPSEDGAGVLDSSGFKVRLPRKTDARIAIVAVPGRVVIVDVLPEPGTLALSERALTGLEIDRGDRKQPLQILALRRLDQAPDGRTVTAVNPESPSTAAPWQAPEPPSPSRPDINGNAESVAPADPVPSEDTANAPPQGTFATIQIGDSVDTVMKSTPPESSPTTGATGTLALQAGVFGNEENARRFVKSLKDIGIPSEIRGQTTSGGSRLWRVLAGPFRSEAARRTAKKRGGDLLADAYPVTMP